MKLIFLVATLVLVSQQMSYYTFRLEDQDVVPLRLLISYYADIEVQCNFVTVNSTEHSKEIFINTKEQEEKQCNNEFSIGISDNMEIEVIYILAYNAQDNQFIKSSHYQNTKFIFPIRQLSRNQFSMGYSSQQLDYLVDESSTKSQKVFVQILKCSGDILNIKRFNSSNTTKYDYVQLDNGNPNNYYDLFEQNENGLYSRYRVGIEQFQSRDKSTFLIQYQTYNSNNDINPQDYEVINQVADIEYNNNQLIIKFQGIQIRSLKAQFQYIEYYAYLGYQDKKIELSCLQGYQSDQEIGYNNKLLMVKGQTDKLLDIKFYDVNPYYNYLYMKCVITLRNGVQITKQMIMQDIDIRYYYQDRILQYATIFIYSGLVIFVMIMFSIVQYKRKIKRQNRITE